MDARKKLSDCIGFRDNGINKVKKCLEGISDLNTLEMTAGPHPIFLALWKNSFGIARLLVEHGADVNYRGWVHDSLWFTSIFGGHFSKETTEKTARFLLEYGIRIPPSHLLRWKHHWARPFVETYIFRTWSPENARDWPILLRKQIRTILCSVASRKRQVAIVPSSSFLLLYLFRAVAAAHFVYDT